jgi:hypothetical protein
MATITVNYIAYNRAGNRLNVPLNESVIDTVNETCSADDDYAVSIAPIMEYNGKELQFAFLAASGTSEGSLLSFHPGTQIIPVGDTDIRVTVVYLEPSEMPAVATDVFNLETNTFTNSDFIEIAAENDPETNRESCLISTETATKVIAREIVDSTSFSIWKPFPGENTSGKREHTIEQGQSGYLFAFYDGKD